MFYLIKMHVGWLVGWFYSMLILTGLFINLLIQLFDEIIRLYTVI